MINQNVINPESINTYFYIIQYHIRFWWKIQSTKFLNLNSASSLSHFFRLVSKPVPELTRNSCFTNLNVLKRVNKFITYKYKNYIMCVNLSLLRLTIDCSRAKRVFLFCHIKAHYRNKYARVLTYILSSEHLKELVALDPPFPGNGIIDHSTHACNSKNNNINRTFIY